MTVWQRRGCLLDSYFAAALGIAFLLAVGTGLRFYLVTRLGERVVADIRKAVFDRVIGMSAGLLRADHDRRGPEPDHHRHHTDPKRDRIVGLCCAAQYLMLIGGLFLLIFTSPKLTGLVLLLVPAILVPIFVLGRRLRRLSRENQDLDRRKLRQCIRGAFFGADGAGVHLRGCQPCRVRACYRVSFISAHRRSDPGGDDIHRDFPDFLGDRRGAVDRCPRRAHQGI